VIAAVPPPPAIGAVAFADARSGWAAGRGGILATRDEGRTWQRQADVTVDELTVVDARHAWARRRNGRLLRTTDGTSWTPVGSARVVRVQFVTRTTGFALTSGGRLLRSTDGGTTWTPRATPGRVQSSCFATASTGWTARAGVVWTTHDDGTHWRRTHVFAKRGVPELGCARRDVWVLYHEGAALGHEGYDVFRSLDSGATWRHVLTNQFTSGLHLPEISAMSGPFAALGNGVAIFVGGCGPCDNFGTTSIVRTIDGGRSFSHATPFYGYFARAVAFSDARRGWILTGPHSGSAQPANVGIVWSTNDGGRHWERRVTSPLLGA
jgi:photosystem II stability/assembly factor-like uncharacterized protein